MCPFVTLCVRFSRYRVGVTIGKGSFGECKDCTCLNSNRVYAVKVVESNPEGGVWSPLSIYKREVQFLRSLNHCNVIRFIAAYEDRKYLYIVTEKYGGGEVFDRLLTQKRFKESDAASVMHQAFGAIAYIHSMGIVHRDIKAENFLFASDGTVKLIDFGLAAWVDSDSQFLSSVVGSAHYLAPEMIRQKYSKSVDVWSAGVLTYLLIFGRYPFDGQNDDSIIRRIKRGQIDWSGEHVSSAAFDLIHQLLDTNVARRPTAREVLKHRFFASVDELTEAEEDHKIQVEVDQEAEMPESIVEGLKERVEEARLSRRTSLENERLVKRLSELGNIFVSGGRRLSRSASTFRGPCGKPRDTLAALALVSPKRPPVITDRQLLHV